MIIGAAKYCVRCWSSGQIRKRGKLIECPCVERGRVRFRNSLPSDWWKLWLDKQRRPEHFPPYPCTRSSLDRP